RGSGSSRAPDYPRLLGSSVESMPDQWIDHRSDAVEARTDRLAVRMAQVDALQDDRQLEVRQAQVEAQFADVATRPRGVPGDGLVGGEVARRARRVGDLTARRTRVQREVLVGQHHRD